MTPADGPGTEFGPVPAPTPGPGAFSAVCEVLGWDRVRTWRSALLETAAQDLKATSNRLLSLADEIDATATPADWHGEAADRARQERRRLTRDLEEFVAGVAAARRALFQGADAVAVIERQVAQVERFAAVNELMIGAGGRVSDARPAAPWPVPLLGQPSVQPVAAERQRLVEECVAAMDDVLRAATELDADLGARLGAVVAGRVKAPLVGGLGAADAAGDVQTRVESNPPPAGAGTPAGNATWWTGLSPDEKAYVIAEHPEWIGNRDGVDFASRDQANRALAPTYRADLLEQRARLRAQADRLVCEMADSPTPQEPWAQRQKIVDQLKDVDDKLASLDTVDSILAEGNRQLLALDMTHERAQAAIAVGTVDTAAHVGVFTPGLTSTVQGMTDYDKNMYDLRQHAMGILDKKGEGNASVAMVTWLGYQAPQLSPDSLLSGNSVALAGAARDGGEDLAAFYQGINTSRDTDPDLTALGHSYGSTTTGYALTGDHTDTGVDRVGFFGSPGVHALTANDVHVPSGQVYYAEAAGDLIGDLNRFGLDPSNMPGVQHLETRASFDAAGLPLTGIGGITSHVHYLDEGTTSQYNLAALVAGHPELTIEGNNRGLLDGNPIPQVPINPWGPRQS